MEVRIRHSNDTTSRVLADVPFRPEVISAIIPTLESWGVVDSRGNLTDNCLTGQFVDDGTTAFFEVIIGLED